MSLFDLFRRFFEPAGRRDPFFGGMTQDDDDDEDDDDYDEDENVGNPFDRVPAHNFGFSFGPGATRFHDAFGFQELFRDFNELFADFGAITVRVPELPGIEPPSPVPEGATSRSPRDSMLKYPDSYLPREHSQDRPRLPGTTPWGKFHWEDHAGSISQSNVRQDKDLDAEVSSRGLDTILRPSEPKPSSYFQSVSVSRVTRPDGTVEERRSVRDSQGHTTSTVTLKRGEQILSSTTQDPPEGTRDGDRTGATQGKIGSPVMDLSDSETVLNRILQRFFSQR
ncbi:HCLS1-associated protein X-1 isoform X2 [Ascaphus truei]|uniref:HCLS1-associated protein X-1 isoform X2 n=1 Tax=Ascaphus truei TaxID=8439 RepID=UPI003F5A10C8